MRIDISQLTEHEKEKMKQTYKAIKNGKMYAMITHVSQSGLSRRVKFFYPHKGGIVRASVWVAWLSGIVTPGKWEQGGKYVTDEGVKIDGCGMDMIFYTLYRCLEDEDRMAWSQNYNYL